MLIEVDANNYAQLFPHSPHPYISEPFIELVKGKADRIVRLIEDHEKVELGLVAGIKDRKLVSPFSSPFGGFHFRRNNIFTSDIDTFLSNLITYSISNNLEEIKILLPPVIYHHSFNSKMVNALLRKGFLMGIPEISNWIDLHKFSGEFSFPNSRRNFNQSIRHNLSFHEVFELAEKQAAYNLICQNREWLGRPIYMTFKELIETGMLWPIDYFHARDKMGENVAAAIFYRGHPQIVQGIFWGDNEQGRCLRAIDFCFYNLWNHYKKMGFNFIDLGISTESGIPNNGLIRFKEDHDSISGLRMSFNLSLINTNNNE